MEHPNYLRWMLLLLPLLMTTVVVPACAPSRPVSCPASTTPTKSNDALVAKPSVLALKFEADWCEPCKALAHTLKAVTPQYEKRSILFVSFDFTDEATIANSSRLANMLGVNEIFDKQFGQLSVVLLVDAHTKEILAAIEADHSSEKMTSLINAAIQRASRDAQ